MDIFFAGKKKSIFLLLVAKEKDKKAGCTKYHSNAKKYSCYFSLLSINIKHYDHRIATTAFFTESLKESNKKRGDICRREKKNPCFLFRLVGGGGNLFRQSFFAYAGLGIFLNALRRVWL